MNLNLSRGTFTPIIEFMKALVKLNGFRECCDENIDIKSFLLQTEEHINRSLAACQDGIRNKLSNTIVESTTLAAR